KIRPAIPFVGLAFVLLEWALVEEQRIPTRHTQTNVERKWERIALHLMIDRLERREIGADRHEIVMRRLRVVRIRKRPIEMPSVGPNALLHRPQELVVVPCTYAGLAIGRDVRAHDGAERRLDRQAAGKGLSSRRRMAGNTITDGRKVAPTLDLL